MPIGAIEFPLEFSDFEAEFKPEEYGELFSALESFDPSNLWRIHFTYYGPLERQTVFAKLYAAFPDLPHGFFLTMCRRDKRNPVSSFVLVDGEYVLTEHPVHYQLLSSTLRTHGETEVGGETRHASALSA